MAVEQHTIKDQDGNLKTYENLTPVKAIRLHCLECLGYSYDEVKKCTAFLCPLFPFREGKNPKKRVGEATLRPNLNENE